MHKIILVDFDAENFAQELIWLGISFSVSYTNDIKKDVIFISEDQEFEKLSKQYLKDSITQLTIEQAQSLENASLSSPVKVKTRNLPKLKISNQDRIEEIENRIDWMNENYSGCDWCCGGGDEEMLELQEELKNLKNEE
jgi:hypothetical protein